MIYSIIFLIATIILIVNPTRKTSIDTSIIENGILTNGTIKRITDVSSLRIETGNTMYRVDLTYTTKNNITYRNVGYFDKLPDFQKPIDVYYLEQAPSKFSIVTNQFSFITFVTYPFAFFPGILFLLFINYSLYKSVNAIKLLKFGYVADGYFIKMHKETHFILRKNTYKCTYRFLAYNNKEYKFSDWTKNIEDMNKNTKKRIIYDSHYPLEARLVDTLPYEARKYITNFVSFFKKI